MLFDVAIIGYGPTGATMANLLAMGGHSVLVIDKEADLYPLPRAVHFDDEVMRIFQTIGIAKPLTQAVHINPGMRFIDQHDRLLLDWPRPQQITSHGWHASYRLHQPDLERLLRDRLADYADVTTLTNMAVTAIRDLPDYSLITGTDRTTGRIDTFTARFVIGCDGANSFVRQHIAAEMEDLGFAEDWLVIDVVLDSPRSDLGDHTIQFCYPDRPMTYCRNPGARRRWEFALKKEEDREAICAPETIWQLLSKWISPQEATLERRQVYTFRSHLAQSWQQGRYFLAGDAAHLTPPFMGQGMCMGIRDAANLSWKLDSVLAGKTDMAILDSYMAERAPHARAFIETAIHLGGLIHSLDTETALRLADPKSEGHKQLKPLAPKLGTSALFDETQHQMMPDVGRPCPQIKVGNNQTPMDDMAGANHIIIATCRPENLASDILCLTPDDSPQIAPLLAQQNAEALWVRPDRYIGAMAPDAKYAKQLFPGFLWDS